MKNKWIQTEKRTASSFLRGRRKRTILVQAILGFGLIGNALADDSSLFGDHKVSLAPAPPGAEGGGGQGTDLPAPKVTHNEISVSADYMQGYGTITAPIGFSIQKNPDVPPGLVIPAVEPGDRDSTFYGATISYSRGQSWYFDVGYAHGISDGVSSSPIFGTVNYRVTEDYYQTYLRYVFPLRGTRFSAYARAGFTYVDGELKADDVSGFYTQKDEVQDILGNVGLGMTYAVYATPNNRFRVSLQAEAEGFLGHRYQNSAEVVQIGTPLVGPDTQLDNDLFGTIGRGTVRMQLRINRSGLARAFTDVGLQGKYTVVSEGLEWEERQRKKKHGGFKIFEK